MSALRSTLVCGCTCPLAVTEATRSRRSTGSMRTSVALFLLFAAVVKPMIATTSTAPPISPHFLRFDIEISRYLSGWPTALSRAANAL